MWTGTKKGVMWRTHALLRISFRPGTGLSYIPDTSTYCCTSSQVSTDVYIYRTCKTKWYLILPSILYSTFRELFSNSNRPSYSYLKGVSSTYLYTSIGRSYRRIFCQNFKIFCFAHFLVFPHFPFFFPNYWNAKPSKYFALCKISKLWKCFLFFLLFLGKKRGKFG